MPLTAVLGVAGIASAGISAVASSNAANAQKKAAQTAQQTQMSMFNTATGELQPFINAGQGVLPTLSKLSGTGPGGSADIQATLETLPGYQFARQQGLESTQNGFAARGLGTSGAALKGAAGYATNLANTNYSNYFDQLLRTAQLGAGSAASLAGNATAAGQGIASSQIGAGNATAAGSVGVGNAIAGGINSIGSSYLLNSLLNSSNQSSTNFANTGAGNGIPVG